MVVALAFTLFQFSWSAAWAYTHLRIRRARRYARGRAPSGALDLWYRRLNRLLFAGKLALSVACQWSESDFLLEFQHTIWLRMLGAAMLASALALTLSALQHLGENYSPCYDSHLPRSLCASGPYAWIRHPMYLAKLLAGSGMVLFSGSLWLAPSAVYLFVITSRALSKEERELSASLPGYEHYRDRTQRLIPGLF